MDHAYEEASKRVKKKKKFLKELSVFVPVAIGLMVLNLSTAPNNIWFFWAIGPWGLTLIARGLSMGIANKSGNWEEREMRKELRSMGKNPDDYMDDTLGLDDLEPEYTTRSSKYKDDDFV
ncbi:MAG: hypothetical protein ACJATI_004512 [Halioglobus sp.]|jgi:hypothetical protein